MTERGVRIPLSDRAIDMVRRHSGVDEEVERDELAIMAGIIYQTGGTGAYILRSFAASTGSHIPQSNQQFIGHRARTKEEALQGMLTVPAAKRRKGFLYWAVAVSDVIGTAHEGKAATALMVGYVRDDGSKGDLVVDLMATTPAPPIAWYAVTDFDKGAIDWPEAVRKEDSRHRYARTQCERPRSFGVEARARAS